MTDENPDVRSPRDRAYDLHFLKKLGELTDFSGRALVAAGFGGGLVARLAQENIPTAGIWEWVLAIAGFALIYIGISWRRHEPTRTRNTAMFDTSDPFMVPALGGLALLVVLPIIAWMHRDRRRR